MHISVYFLPIGPTFILVLAGRPHKRNCTFWYRRIRGSPTANFFWDCPAIWNVIAKSSVCKMLILHACIQFRCDLLERNNNFLCSLCDIVASVWMNLKQIENLITSRVGFIPSHDSCLMPAAGKWVKPSQDIRWWAHIHNLPNLEAWKLWGRDMMAG